MAILPQPSGTTASTCVRSYGFPGDWLHASRARSRNAMSDRYAMHEAQGECDGRSRGRLESTRKLETRDISFSTPSRLRGAADRR